ncbi:MAG: pentapeptide repeat-containing protein [Bryobacteraceae bacterium]
MANPDHVAFLRSGVDTWREWRSHYPDVVPDLAGADLRRADLRGVPFGKSNLAGTDLRESILREADLSCVSGLHLPQLTGADLGGAKLPESLGSLSGELDVAKAISENAQKLFVAVLAACLYSWLTIATTTDAGLVTNRASSPLPIIQTTIPIVGFYVVTPLLLVGIYFYFHLYLQKLWDELGSLPAIFPDGRRLQSKADPWLLSDLVGSHVFNLRSQRPFLAYLQAWISILLGWWIVPITLMLFWARYLPRHDKAVSAFHCALTAICVSAAIFLYRLASATLRGEQRPPFAWKSALERPRAWYPLAVAIAAGMVLAILSAGAIDGVRPGASGHDWWPPATGPRAWIPAAMAKCGYSPFADLRAADISLKPAAWTGKSDAELDSVKGLQLSGVDLRYADMRGTFLAGSILTGAHLEWADLLLADLRQTGLAGAHLQDADLLGARLNGADLSNAGLSNADLTGADLTDAELKYADLRGARGISPGDLAKAKNWKDAFYSADELRTLKLPQGNNEVVQSLRASEFANPGNTAAGEAARVEQLSRLVPGKNTEAVTFMARLITHNGGATEVASVPVTVKEHPGGTPSNNGAAGPEKPFFTVTELARIYNFPGWDSPKGLGGRGQTIGIVEFGGGYRDSDITAYFAGLKIPKPDTVSISVDGKNNSPGASGVDSQVEQDIEVAGAAAPGAQLVVYFSDFTSKGWVDAIAAARQDTAHRPSVLLIGWGSAEGQPVWPEAAMQAVDDQLRQAALAGITIVVAAGDDGPKNNTADGRAHADFPASSQWVLAVGGTKLVASGNAPVSETVWNDGPNGGATGGGVSDYFPRPDWQLQVPVPARANGEFGRGFPDVAANASPQTGYQLLIDGQVGVIGGTGAAAALWSGLIALLNQSLGHNVGYLNNNLYRQIGPAGVLRAIAKGDNSYGGVKGYSAGPGWNACTGWGTPDGKKLLEKLRSLR